jgi:hypothetical protein
MEETHEQLKRLNEHFVVIEDNDETPSHHQTGHLFNPTSTRPPLHTTTTTIVHSYSSPLPRFWITTLLGGGRVGPQPIRRRPCSLPNSLRRSTSEGAISEGILRPDRTPRRDYVIQRPWMARQGWTWFRPQSADHTSCLLLTLCRITSEWVFDPANCNKPSIAEAFISSSIKGCTQASRDQGEQCWGGP